MAEYDPLDNEYTSDESTRLLPPQSAQNPRLLPGTRFVRKHPRCLVYLFVLVVVLAGIGLASYFVYFHGRVRLKVFEYNVWGMPGGIGGCKYKAERMKALSALIKSRSPQFDLFLLAELWMEADHNMLEAAAKNVSLHMTEFRQLASR
jgi:hypothetical protein